MGSVYFKMPEGAGKYFAVAETGQRIWELLDKPRSISEIVSTLRGEYDVAMPICVEQVTGFADDLLAHGLVTEVGDGQAA